MLLVGITLQCTWECEGQYAAAVVVLELGLGIMFRSPEASSGSVQ